MYGSKEAERFFRKRCGWFHFRWKFLLPLLAPFLALWASQALPFNQSLIAYASRIFSTWNTNGLESYSCESHKFLPTILLTDPLLIHLQGFITEFEAQHLVSLSTELLESSTFGEDGRKIDLDIRSSKSAILPESENYTDPVIQCIKERASKFQGHVPLDHMEPLQVVHYSANEYYHTHYDAFEHDDLGEINRETSFFLIIQESDVIGGGTNFPRIHTDCEWPPAGLCEHLECACSEGGKNTTLTVKPVQGNGIFWQNLRPDGSIHPRTLHAGLKLEAGVKVGLNIWTWSASLQ